jgi:uncharacterized protein
MENTTLGYPRHLAATLLSRSQQYPVVTVTGPRQAGKTTLCRDTFPHLPYANLERPDTREFARSDPQGFLAQFKNGAVLDEIQRVPEILSWVQVAVDEQARPSGRQPASATAARGPLILTGSHNFELLRTVTQSLAGRTALLQLLPLSINELRDADVRPSIDRLIHAGGYPRIHADGLDPSVALADYVATYVERDLRELIELRQLDTFRRFLRLAAGRVGQVLNMQGLAVDAGVSGATVKAWISLLEASFIVRLLPPWFANIGKRLIKSPKLYFCDTGLAAWLMGINEESQIAQHPLRGHLFENLVVMEFVKHALHHGQVPALHYYRDSAGIEVDLVVEQGLAPGALGLVEIKAGQTFHPEFLRPMRQVAAWLGPKVQRRMVVYGGRESYVREGIEVAGVQT